MSMLDDMENKGKEMMDDPNVKSKVEQIAKEKGISVEEAKKHFMEQNNQQ